MTRRAKSTTPTETDECRTFVAWTKLVHFRGRPLFDRIVKIPNERGARGVMTAILTAIGMRAGFPDYLCLVPTPGCPGLFIEAKREGEGPSDDQVQWRDRLREFGYESFVCEGHLSMIEAVRTYMRAHAPPGWFEDRTRL